MRDTKQVLRPGVKTGGKDDNVDIVLHTVLRERPLLRDLLDPTRVMHQRDVWLVEDRPCGIAQHMRKDHELKQPKRVP